MDTIAVGCFPDERILVAKKFRQGRRQAIGARSPKVRKRRYKIGESAKIEPKQPLDIKTPERKASATLIVQATQSLFGAII